MKKLLILGGKPIGSVELVKKAKEKGFYTIVADYLDAARSPAKRISDESWNISTDDVDLLAREVQKNHVDGVLAGVHEFCLRKALQVCEKCGLPSWCTLAQWDHCNNKKNFKALCVEHGIDVAKTYTLGEPIPYPVIVKPADSSGSMGFSICHSDVELEKAIQHALAFSNDYLIEEFVRSDACIIHYTAINGKIFFSGISDKHSRCLKGGSMVMALQTFPADDQKRYLEEVNDKAIRMFEDLGIKNSPIWIEAFNDGHRFVFNEMALRFGGSMTNYPVQYYTGLNQLELFIDAAVGEVPAAALAQFAAHKDPYAILPIHLKEGRITKICGAEELLTHPRVAHIVLVHHVGDEIKNWGTAQQVFCYLHMTYQNEKDFSDTIQVIQNTLRVEDEAGQNMLYLLMDFDSLRS